MGKKQRRWKGELAKRIRPKVIRPKALRVTDAETVAKANTEMNGLYQPAIEKEQLEKLDLLMAHYGIADRNDFFSLALALAIDHMPGFQVDPTPLRLEGDEDGPWLVVQGNKRGRRLEWPSERLDSLLRAVEDAKRRHGFSEDREALADIARKNKEWSRPANHQGSFEQWLETLESRLQDAKRRKREIESLKTQIEALGQNSGNSKPVC